MPYHVRQRDRAPSSEPPPPDPDLPRAAVIGAGSCGLAATKALAGAGVPVDCFEAGSVVGGNWVIHNPNGISGCYETLEMNTSGPRMAFSDFPMPADVPPYPAHHHVADYLEAYVDHFGFRDRIVLDTTVTTVEPVEGGRWSVTTRGPQGARTEVYDAVLVANGHHWDPSWPEPAYPGSFDGDQIHAHDYRSGEQLRGRDVVVVAPGTRRWTSPWRPGGWRAARPSRSVAGSGSCPSTRSAAPATR